MVALSSHPLAAQAEASTKERDPSRAHMCKIIEVHSGNHLRITGTISDCEWDEQESMVIYYLTTAEDDPLVPVKCPVGAWLIIDMHNFALCLQQSEWWVVPCAVANR